MMDLTKARLVHLARSFYPTGFPVTTDDYTQDLHPYQRTPEHARWLEAWDKAMVWPEWKTLIQEMRRTFDAIADSTQPRVAACRKCCVYLRHPLPKGAYQLTRVAAAASVLAPLYVTYCTTEIVVGKDLPSQERRLLFELPEEVQPRAAALSALIERILGYQAFPHQFANVLVPGTRVDYVPMDREPTLLDAFFDSQLDSLF
jgi:ribosome modulation factor